MVYLPEDDSFLLLDVVKQKVSKNDTVIEIGTGSGFIAGNIADSVSKIYAFDIDSEAVAYAKKKYKKDNLRFQISDLFKKINIKADIIIFNPPYLPVDKEFFDIALHTESGNKIIIEFLKSAKNFLKINGRIYLLFSSLSKRNHILKFAKENYTYKLCVKKNLFFEKLYVYEFTPKEYFFAKGKRGKIFLIKKNKKFILKKVPLNKKLNTIENEARFNLLLNKYSIGPKFISFDKKNSALIREFVDGIFIEDFVKKSSKKEIIFVLKKILIQLNVMDMLGINKYELTNPYKHIIIKNKVPFLIDFERCRFSNNPKNITQFLDYLGSNRFNNLLKIKNIFIEQKKVIELSKKYKKEYKNNKKIMTELFKELFFF